KVLLIYCIEDGDHRLLNNLVLQSRNPQWPFPTIDLRYPDSPHRQRPVRSAVNPVVQIDKSFLQTGLILLPSHSVHSRCSFSLERVKALLEQIRCHMVKQVGEPLLFVFPRSLAHTTQSLGHSFPALCRASARFHDVLLGHRPSLRRLRDRCPHRCCSTPSQVLCRCSTPRQRTCPDYAFGFPGRSVAGWLRTPARSLGSRACNFLASVWLSDYAGSLGTRGIVPSSVACPLRPRSRLPVFVFEAQFLARQCLCLRFTQLLAKLGARLEVKMVRYSFLVGLFHPR